MRLLVAVFIFLTASSPVLAQQPVESDLVRIELVDGTGFVGEVIGETPEAITIRTVSGVEATVPRDQIRQLVAFEGLIRDGQAVRLDPNRTRLLFMPTARPLGGGEGYLAVYQVFVPFLAVGLTDRISLSGGTLLIPGAFGRVGYVAPKVTVIEQEMLSVALGGIGLGASFDGTTTTAGIGFGLVTYGTAERALTAGAGVAVADGDLSTGLVLVVGGEWQLSNSIKLVTENYLIPITREDYMTSTRYEPLLGVGVRFFGDQLAVDLGGFTTPSLLGEDLFPFVPWLGFAYNFGH